MRSYEGKPVKIRGEGPGAETAGDVKSAPTDSVSVTDRVSIKKTGTDTYVVLVDGTVTDSLKKLLAVLFEGLSSPDFAESPPVTTQRRPATR